MWCVENKTISTLTQTQTFLKSAQKVITFHKATKHLNRFVKKRPQRFVRWLFSSSMYTYIYIYIYIYSTHTHYVKMYIYIYMYSIFIYIDKYQLYMCWLVHTIPLRPSFGRSNANDQKNAVCFFPLRNSLSLRSYEASFWAETWWIHCVLKYSMTSEYFLVTSFDPRCSKNVQKTTILTYSTKEYIYIYRDSIWFQDSWYWPNHKTVNLFVVMFAFHTWKKNTKTIQNYRLLRCCFRDVDRLQQYLCIPTSWRKTCRKLQCVARSHGFLSISNKSIHMVLHPISAMETQ